MRWYNRSGQLALHSRNPQDFSIQNSTQCATANFSNLKLLDTFVFPLQNAIRLNEFLQSAAKKTQIVSGLRSVLLQWRGDRFSTENLQASMERSKL